MRFAVYLTNCAALFAFSKAADIGSITEVPVMINAPAPTEAEADTDAITEAEAEAESGSYLELDAEA